jgi:hypothetical protein
LSLRLRTKSCFGGTDTVIVDVLLDNLRRCTCLAFWDFRYVAFSLVSGLCYLNNTKIYLKRTWINVSSFIMKCVSSQWIKEVMSEALYLINKNCWMQKCKVKSVTYLLITWIFIHIVCSLLSSWNLYEKEHICQRC